jgi:hypothetical protein
MNLSITIGKPTKFVSSTREILFMYKPFVFKSPKEADMEKVKSTLPFCHRVKRASDLASSTRMVCGGLTFIRNRKYLSGWHAPQKALGAEGMQVVREVQERVFIYLNMRNLH